MRKPAAWGLFVCLALLGLGGYLLRGGLVDLCPLCLTSAPLIAGIGAVFFLVVISHPRRVACRFYATIISLFSFAGLALTIRHLWTQVNLAPNLPNCEPNLLSNFGSISFIQPYRTVISGVRECVETQTLLGLPLAYLFFSIFFLFSAYSIFLLFRRIDRDIFR